jgi:hypothetical protein
MTAPVLTIENVSPAQAYAGVIAPKVTFADLNLELYSSSVEITRANSGNLYYNYNTATPDDYTKLVTFTDFPHEPEYDDVYIFTAQAIDRAGNIVQSSFAFSVNRFGSTYWFNPATESLNGTYINAPQNITIYEINASGLDESRISVNLSIDSSTRLLEKGTDYSLSSEINRETMWHQYTYVLPASLLVADGRYNITVRSTDNAGSLSENTMSNKTVDRTSPAELSFVYDKTAPTATIEGAATGSVYIRDTLVITAYARDNIAWDKASLVVNGTEVMLLVNDDNSKSARFDYSLAAAEESLTVSLVVTDKAGNKTTVSVSNIIITASAAEVVTKLTFWEWWEASATMRILIVSFVVMIASALFFWIYITYRRKKRTAEEGKIVFSDNNQSGSRRPRDKK